VLASSSRFRTSSLGDSFEIDLDYSAIRMASIPKLPTSVKWPVRLLSDSEVATLSKEDRQVFLNKGYYSVGSKQETRACRFIFPPPIAPTKTGKKAPFDGDYSLEYLPTENLSAFPMDHVPKLDARDLRQVGFTKDAEATHYGPAMRAAKAIVKYVGKRRADDSGEDPRFTFPVDLIRDNRWTGLRERFAAVRSDDGDECECGGETLLNGLLPPGGGMLYDQASVKQRWAPSFRKKGALKKLAAVTAAAVVVGILPVVRRKGARRRHWQRRNPKRSHSRSRNFLRSAWRRDS